MRCETFIPHVGWLAHPPDDRVGRFLAEGWFEYREQALWWLYLREGDAVIDAGAHAGLYTALAARVIGDSGRVLSVEAGPANMEWLRRNIQQYGEPHGASRCAAVHAALTSFSGEIEYFPGAATYSAYGYAGGEPAGGPLPVRVPACTFDQLCARPGFDQIALAKIDVEGGELDVLRGACDAIRNRRVHLWMVEFAEENLARRGASTRELFDLCFNLGFTVCRFEAERLRLAPFHADGPIWWENLFLTSEPDRVNHRLETCGEPNARIARDILARGAAAEAIYSSASRRPELEAQLGDAQTRLADAERRIVELLVRLEDTGRSTTEALAGAAAAAERSAELSRHLDHSRKLIDEANARADEEHRRARAAEERADKAAERADEAHRQARAAEERADKAAEHADEAHRQARAAEERADEAAEHADEAHQLARAAGERADDLSRHLDESWRRIGEANWRADEAVKRAEDAQRRVEAAWARAEVSDRRAGNSQHEAELAKRRLGAILSNRAVRLAWMFHLARQPAWAENSLASAEGLGSPEEAPADSRDPMNRALYHLVGKGFSPKVILDAGAAQGYWSLNTHSFFPGAEYFLVDPLEENAAALERIAAKDPQFHYIRTALGREKGSAFFKIEPDLDGSYWLPPGRTDGREVPVCAADELIEAGLIRSPDFVKLDVQGSEMNVLLGADRTLASCEVLIVEVNLFRYLPGWPVAHEVIAHLAGKGFVLFDVAGQLRRPHEDDLGQIDLVFAAASSALVASSRWD